LSYIHRSSVGYFCRISESFATKRLQLINQHTEQINAIIATNNGTIVEDKIATDVIKDNEKNIDPALQPLTLKQ